MKIIVWVGCLLIAAIFLEFVISLIYPAGFETKSTQRAQALLFTNTKPDDLPDQVEIVINGASASFVKNTRPFADLVELLQNGRSDEAAVQAGTRPSFSTKKHACGEVIISSYGITSHFTIIRSDENTNYYWIRLPKLTSPGRSFPIFTWDSRVIDFLHSTSVSQKPTQTNGVQDNKNDWEQN